MPVQLNFNERRVLGTLIEKGYTTPEQYPLSLNAVVVGANQKSCREPISYIDEEKALDTLESLQAKGFSILVRMAGSRVDRWKHRCGEVLTLESKEVAILAELLLRGPQTEGELRQRASRMRPVETSEELERFLEGLLTRPDPLIRRMGPEGRSRGVKYAHCFYPAAETPVEHGSRDASEVEASPTLLAQAARPVPHPAPGNSAYIAPASQDVSGAVSSPAITELQRRVHALEDRVAELEATFVKFLK